jgi:hypothetical protein
MKSESRARAIVEAESPRMLLTRLAAKHRQQVEKRLKSKVASRGPEPRSHEALDDKAWWWRENTTWNEHTELWEIEGASSDYDFVNKSNVAWFEENFPGLFQRSGYGFGLPDERRFDMSNEQFKRISDAVDSLSGYPLLDEEGFSKLEYEAKEKFWEEFARDEVKEALVKKFKGNTTVEMVLRQITDKDFDEWALSQQGMDQHIEFEGDSSPYLHIKYALEGIDADDITGLVDLEKLNDQMALSWANRIYETWLAVLSDVRRNDPNDPKVLEIVSKLPYEKGWRLFRKLMDDVGAEWQFLDSRQGLDRDFDVSTDDMKAMAMALRPEMLLGLQPEDPRQLDLAIEQILAGAPTFIIFEGFREKRALFISQGHDEAEVDEVLTIFKQLKQRSALQGEQGDIDRYSDFGTLKQTVDEASKATSKTQAKLKVRREQAIVLRDDDEMSIVVPKTRAAAIQYGKGTQWCISAVNTNHWETYHEKMAKHHLIHRKDVTPTDPYYKIAVTIYPDGTHSIFDARDHSMSDEQLRHYTGMRVSDFGPWQEDEMEGRDLFRLLGLKDMSFMDRVEHLGEEGWARLSDNALRDLWSQDQAAELRGLTDEQAEQQWLEFWMDARRDLLAHPDDEDYANHLRYYLE